MPIVIGVTQDKDPENGFFDDDKTLTAKRTLRLLAASDHGLAIEAS